VEGFTLAWSVGKNETVKASDFNREQQFSTNGVQQVQYQSVRNNKFQQVSIRVGIWFGTRGRRFKSSLPDHLFSSRYIQFWFAALSGVVRNMRHESLDQPSPPVVYLPFIPGESAAAVASGAAFLTVHKIREYVDGGPQLDLTLPRQVLKQGPVDI